MIVFHQHYTIHDNKQNTYTYFQLADKSVAALETYKLFLVKGKMRYILKKILPHMLIQGHTFIIFGWTVQPHDYLNHD